MRSTPQSVNTRYAGLLFRSRLEARWAAFFDLAKVEWQYEPKDDIPPGWWPDFRVTVTGRNDNPIPMLAEVKPVRLDPIVVNSAYDKAISSQWALMLGLAPLQGFIGFAARRGTSGIETVGMTISSDCGIYGAPLSASVSAMAERLWLEADSIVTPAGVSAAINGGIEAHTKKPLFNFEEANND